MSDGEVHQQLIDAAREFPVRGWPLDLDRRVVRRRRTTVGFALAAGVVAAAGLAVAIPVMTGSSSGPDRPAPPAAVADASYVGGSWRLTSVAEGSGSIVFPADVGTRMDLLPDGRILIDNGVNAISGRFTTSADGFEVRDVGSTFVLYGGSDPRRLAAIAALNTLAYGNRDGVTSSSPARDTVLSADGARLVVQAGPLRLTFERTGPASATRADPSPPGKPS